jgi:glycosyltransferase involved in cell wall biosynthesis
MRILYFHQHFTTPDGTGGTRSYEFAKALMARGHRVTMVCGRSERSALQLTWDPARQWSRGDIEGIDVIALPLAYSNRDGLARRAALFMRFAWRGLRLAWRKSEYDLLFATSTPLTAVIPGVAMKLVGGGRPFVFEIRDLWPELPRALGVKNPLLLGGMSLLEWLGYRTADACIGLSPGIVAGIKRRSPAGRRVEMIPNGCDLGLFSPGKRQFLASIGVQSGDFVAGFTGAHGKANGLEAVLEAAAELKRRGRDRIKLVLIGDGGSKEVLVARAQREGLDNVLFLAPVKKTDLASITAGFDCGLQILANIPEFYYGTSPNKFFDYLAAGIPVLCNYPGWLAELIAENRCGVAIPPANPGAFADALCHLQDDPALAIEYGRNARRLAEDKFNRGTLSKNFVNIIESVAGKRP